MKKVLLTVKELAAELRMSPKSIERVYRKEEIPVRWLGRMARFDLALCLPSAWFAHSANTV